MISLEQGRFYHIYNRGVDSQVIFPSVQDKTKFLKLYKYYLGASVKLYSYCLMENHFHLLIFIDSKLEENLINLKASDYYILPNEEGKDFKVEKLLGHLLNAYSRYFNRKYYRTGPLWDSRYKRKEVNSDEYLRSLICYINRNPIHHKITTDFLEYEFTSYDLGSAKNGIVARKEVLDLFGNVENYTEAHRESLRIVINDIGTDEFE